MQYFLTGFFSVEMLDTNFYMGLPKMYALVRNLLNLVSTLHITDICMIMTKIRF